MKILIVSVNNENDPYPVAPLGSAYIAAAMNHNGHSSVILDLCFEHDWSHAIESAVRVNEPDIIAISIRNVDNLTFQNSISYLPRIRSISEHIRSLTEAPVIGGGSGFSLFPEEIIRYLDLDAGIIGEGEDAVPAYAAALRGAVSLDSVPGLCRVIDGRYIANERRFMKCEIVPDRSLIDNSAYLAIGGMANIQSKRGCPFHCTYCTYPAIEGTHLRLRQPSDVVAELTEMKMAFGLDYVFFVDDIFNFPQDHAAGICEEILSSGLKMDWTCFATPADMTQELAGLMKRAGCRGVEFGSDAGDDTTLRGLGKGFGTEDIHNAASACRSVDLTHAHYIIIGGPGEDENTLEATLTFLDRIDPTAVIAIAGIRIYPGTRLKDIAVQDRIIQENEDLLEPAFYMSPSLSTAYLMKKLVQHGGNRSNWIIPGMQSGPVNDMISRLRQRGVRGPLWDFML